MKRYPKTNSKKDYRNSPVGEDAGRPPVRDGNGSYDDMLSRKSLKDLPKTPISIYADPYTNSLPGSVPYALLNQFNKILGGRYSGDKNIDGGTTMQYSNSVTSKFLNIFDTAMMKLGLNYRYLPILASDTSRGQAMVDEMRKAIAEVCSTLAATTFSSQNIYYYAVETDLPMGSAVPINVGSGNIPMYNEIQDVIYAMGIMYQLMIQSVTLVFNQFNAFRLKEGEMLRMSFNRETPGLNGFFSLMNKKAFLGLWDSLAYTIEGEYVDTDFMVQSNMLGLIASRRSESMNDPLLEIVSTFNFPSKFKTYAFAIPAIQIGTSTTVGAPVFDLDDLVYVNSLGTAETFQEALSNLAVKCTANDTLKWVRHDIMNVSDNTRYNSMKNSLDTITYCMTIFKTAFNDFRSVLDIVNRSGINQWKKNVKLKVINDTDSVIVQNLIVDNIYQLVLSGDEKVVFDDNTKRWSVFTLWNQYYGIPEHDTYSGGIFITLSTKTRDSGGSSDSNINYLPIAFSVKTSDYETICRLVNRRGFDIPLTYSIVTMSDNYAYSRLVPLNSQNTYQLRVPTVIIKDKDDFDRIDEDDDGQQDLLLGRVRRSFIYKFMLQVFGVASVPVSYTVVEGGTDIITSDYGLDSDIFSVYDLQVTDFTNEVITYARSKGPFIVNSVDSSNLGFYGTKIDHK